MPFVRIYVDQSKSDSDIEVLSNVVHQSLVSSFDVPAEDKFHIIHKLPSSQRLYHASYETPRGSERTEDWILIEITAGKPRSQQMKKQLYDVTTKNLQETANIDPVNVMFIVSTNQIEDWSFSSGQLASLPK